MNIKIKIFVVLSLSLAGCKKYLDTALPSGTISQENAFVSDNAISSVVTGNFQRLQNTGMFGGSSNANLGYILGLYTDELQNLSTANLTNIAFYGDNVQYINASQWTDTYTKILAVNQALEGIEGTSAVLYYKNQWLGETYFTRALLYFYLTNLYGDVPLALSSNLATNNVLSRAPQSQVYQQVIADLHQAMALLNPGYTDGYGASSTHRDRPNRYTAVALLAKTYLYAQKWDSAEIACDTLIADSSVYKLVTPLASVFNGNTTETIWGLAPPAGSAAVEYGWYVGGLPSTISSPAAAVKANVYAPMDTALVNTFEPGDNRRSIWIRPVTVTTPAETLYYPFKYSSSATNSYNDIILRVAEIYLIRAEARARQNNIAGAQADLNAIRARAGLGATTAVDQASLLNAIMHERRVELFTECGNRFFDLKRTGAIDSVMTAFAPTKGVGAVWSHYMQLLPLSPTDIIQDPNLTQNPGYQ